MNQRLRTILTHGGLFVVTLATTMFSGAELTHGKSIFVEGSYTWSDFLSGASFAIPFLLILTVHEFGHYFTAMYHRVKVTLPYYIPLPWFLFPVPLGTMGAVIRIKGPVWSKQQHFDIGIAGPLAGFVVAIGVLWYGFTHLPPPEYIFQIHPEYAKYGLGYAKEVYKPAVMGDKVLDVFIGKNLLYELCEYLAPDPSRVPNVHEVMHYPYLFAGFISLVFTSMNLLPVGQLDGGHILYGLVGYRLHRIIASGVFMLFLFFAVLGLVTPATPFPELIWEIPIMIGFLYMALRGLAWKPSDTILAAVAMFTVQYIMTLLVPQLHGYPIWLLFAFLVGRLVGVRHPPAPSEAPLNTWRIVLGWFALLVFIITFTPSPLQ